MTNKLLLSTLLLVVGTAACTEDEFDPTDAANTLTACTIVQGIFEPKCNQCHMPGGDYPDLTLDGLGQLVNADSLGYPGNVQIVPGNPEASFLYRKMAGPLSDVEGDPMPEKKPLDAATLDFIAQWIREGAVMDCDPTQTTTITNGRYHPDGYDEATVHGYEMELGLETDCRECHGSDLTGDGDADSCDGCHQAGWRDDCTYCHGGSMSDSGAPPRDLAGLVDLTMLSFKSHTAHEEEIVHMGYDCAQCHVMPTDVLSDGHVFDATEGKAEVVFSGGLSAQGTYDGNGGCSNLYCHGNGQSNGSFTDGNDTPECGDCHAGPNSSALDLRNLSGEHFKHLREGVDCVDCHNTLNAQGEIGIASQHVNGTVEIDMGNESITWNGATCDGSCHRENHRNEGWDR